MNKTDNNNQKNFRENDQEKIQRRYMERIRGVREDHDLTQQQVADILGTSQTMYARYERCANELPIRHLVRLAKYYDLSTDYLLCISNRKN